MSHIVLTPEQCRVINHSTEPVAVKDEYGFVRTHIVPLTSEDIEAVARHVRRRGQPKQAGIPAAKVQAFLRRLEEIQEAEGMDEVKMQELLRRTQAGEEI